MGGYQGIVSGMVAGRHCVQVHFRSIAHCQGLCFGRGGLVGNSSNWGGALKRKLRLPLVSWEDIHEGSRRGTKGGEG